MKTHFMDYGYIDIQSTSQWHPTADASFGVTYRTIWRHPEDVKMFLGDVFRTSFGRNFAKWAGLQ